MKRFGVRLARENDGGDGKIEGELLKLGCCLRDETSASMLKRQGIPPLPQRHPSLSWHHLMTDSKDQILACDCFTIETCLCKPSMGSASSRWAVGGCMGPAASPAVHPGHSKRQRALRFLIPDNDSKFTLFFDALFASEPMKVIHTPYRVPNANADAERWVRTVREECRDKLLILNQAHLQRVIRHYIDDYHTARPHPGIDQPFPSPKPGADRAGVIRRRKVLDIIQDDDRDAS